MSTISPERIKELRAMPYEEYLLTPEWMATRKRILKRDRSTCQQCGISGVILNVHHLTYDRLGCEEDQDLITLCEECHHELHDTVEPVPVSLPWRIGIGLGGATATHIAVALAAKGLFPLEVAGLIGSGILAWKCPHVLGHIIRMAPKEIANWMERETQRKQTDGQHEWSTWDRLLGRHEQADVYQIIANMPDIHADEDEFLDDEDDMEDFEGEDDLITIAFEGQKQIHVFSDLLKTGWRPSLEQIYVGTDGSGNHLFVPVKKLWHIALAGATGYGKSGLLRLLMAQLCYLKLSVVLLNPHYMVYDFDNREDWTPYTPYLKRDPMECKKMANIEIMLRWMVDNLLEKRKERAARGESAGKPFFFVLDEFPDIAAEIKDAPTLVGKLLRQGRKYGIYLIVASQNYDVKTLKVEGEGGVRKCFRTIFYVGGDPVSVKELLNKKVSDIPENALGQGTIILRCVSIKDPIVAYIPYLDNKSLYILLGPSTYVKPVQEVQMDELEEIVTASSGSDHPTGADPDAKGTEKEDEPIVRPNIPDKGRKAEDIDPKLAIEIWNAGYNSKRKLMAVFGITDHQALKLMEIIGVKEK